MSSELPPPVLLLIDLQQGMVSGPPEWGSRSTPSLVENVTSLLLTWRSKAWPILHVQHDDIADPTNIISATHPEAFAFHACAMPLESENRFVKHTGGAFVGTGLEEALTKYVESSGGWKEGKVVVVGMDSAQCINSTVRHGVDLGFDMVVVGDACASYELKAWKSDGKGELLSAEDTHAAAMGMLESYCKVTSLDKLMTVLGLESGE
ncbi:hypothetical protein G7Y89_g11483 [Cudoniella acicularis]|uniref:Isochorismatase-like domain-containing protein n=1 Tax=Cudoniella acicularis TaxID=354080 RepID=A0A8H4RAT2_9HELO|nr:hypothetical protein G7Y89_g11483 [Cudoniella acicularis]